MNFSHYTDRSVTLAADLVNTYSPVTGTDYLPDVEALRRFVADHDETSDLDGGELEAVRELRRRLRQVFESKDELAAAEVLNALLAEVGAIPRISAHDGSPIHMHFEPIGAGFALWLGAATAMALAIVLCDFGKDRLGICASDTCQDVFIDTSKNRRKRYCSEACATRENVAAFRARRRAV